LSKRLLDWLKTTDIQIVLSSTWRNHPDMWEHLHQAGIRWLDKTPRLTTERGYEIKKWIDDHPDLVDRYAILDDNSDMLSEQLPRFVQTDTFVGLQDEHIDKLKKLFGG